MTYVYGTICGAFIAVFLYFIIREAVEAGVKAALSSQMDTLAEAAKLGVARGLELDRQDQQFEEEND